MIQIWAYLKKILMLIVEIQRAKIIINFDETNSNQSN